MAKQTINIGSAANDGTGSTLRESFDITNDNFTELYSGTGGLFHKIEGANFTGSLLIGHSTTGTLSNAQNNTGIGIGALDSLTSGDSNVAIGRTAGGALSSGSSNIAIGHNALITEDTGQRSVAIGEGALQVQNNDDNNYNIAIGHHAGQLITTGTQNTLIGALAGDALTTGNRNVAIGYEALSVEDGNGRNVAVGYQSLLTQNAGAEAYNVAIGHQAGKLVEGGAFNTLIGGQAGDALTTGSNNIIIGYNAAASAVDVSNEVTIGNSSIANVRIPADSTLKIGASGDLQLEHLSGHSFIKNTDTGALYIQQNVLNSDMIFQADNGNDAISTYFYLDGSLTNGSSVLGATRFPDKSKIYMGTSGDLEIFHDGSNSAIENYAGNLELTQHADNGDIIFKSDNGSGGTTEYFRLDGSDADGTYTYTRRPDGGVATFGNNKELRIWRDPSSNHSYIRNYVNDLYIESTAVDKDILFRADNGSGSPTTYFQLDGSHSKMIAYKDIHFEDNIKARFGNYATADLQIYHNATNSLIENSTGDFYISNKHDDGDIIFFCDNMSGGTTEYLRLDGGIGETVFSRNTRHGDQVHAQFGDSNDLKIYHNNSNDRGYIYNGTGDLYIENDATDGDIKFFSDDGSDGTTEYFRVDGGAVKTIVSKNFAFLDSVKAEFGDSGDLQIYHDATDAWLDNFTGNLNIRNQQNSGDIIFRCDNGNGGIAEYFRVDGGDQNVIFSKDVVMSQNAGPTLNINTNSAGNTSKILLHEGTTGSPSNGASIRYDGSANNFRIGVGTNVDTTRLTIDRGTGLATFANDVSVAGTVTIANTSGGPIYLEDTDATDTFDITSISNGGGNFSLDTRRTSDNGFVSTDYQIVKDASGANYHRWFTANTERVRINASGYIYVDTDGVEPSASQVGVRITGTQGQAFWNSANSGTTGYNHFNFYNGNGVVGSIVTNGSATAFNTSSDYRLKEDLKDFDGLNKVSKIPVYDFKWKVDDSRSYGVMAHELQEVLPDAVSGEKDAEEMQGVDYSKIVPLLIKSIQELEARVKTLENK